MSAQPPQLPPQPPPMPPPGVPPHPMQYAAPGAPQGPAAPADNVQKVFDTVVGPNIRLMDNLVQLACAVAGAALGAAIGRWYGGGATPPLALGAIGGAIAGVFLSGAAIGVVRFVKAVRKR